MFLIFISMVANDVENFLMCLLAICVSSLEKFYVDPLPTFSWVIFTTKL